MAIQDCEQLSIDNGWTLTRKNACHIANQNDEMGEMRDDMRGLRNDFNEKIEILKDDVNSDFSVVKSDMAHISWNVEAMLWIWGIIGAAIITLVIKRFWGDKKK